MRQNVAFFMPFFYFHLLITEKIEIHSYLYRFQSAFISVWIKNLIDNIFTFGYK